ncbi:MAG: hypothetical protein E7345_00445 [Clostridiales bacterium]|nr:hypothetical protein [Clostridiales bacterium]
MTKLESYIGFAIKSGSAIFGSDKLFEGKKLPKIVLICSSQNEKVSSKVQKFCESNKIECVKLDVLLSDLVKRENCKVIGIIDENLSKAIRNELKSGN